VAPQRHFRAATVVATVQNAHKKYFPTAGRNAHTTPG
jgi:hypothetical protein